MKRIISTLLLSGIALSIFAFSYSVNAKVGLGSRSDEVKVIQEILKSDPEIYPEGYVTGYFGSLTEKAIKKLQKRCGLSETGVVDENTERCIYPIEFGIKVSSPNGGEILDRSQIQTIRWDVIETTTPSSLEGTRPYSLWKKASIDLFKRVTSEPCPPESSEPRCLAPVTQQSIFVRHIATVNLFDKVYSWKISGDILNGKDYLIRISLGPGAGTIWYRENTGQPITAPEIWPVPLKPTWIKWDESDGTFEITGEVKPPTPNLDEVIKILEEIIEKIQRAIALLRGSR